MEAERFVLKLESDGVDGFVVKTKPHLPNNKITPIQVIAAAIMGVLKDQTLLMNMIRSSGFEKEYMKALKNYQKKNGGGEINN